MNTKESLSSKKLWFSVGCVAMAFLYAILAATVMPGLLELYKEFVGVLEFIAAAYLTGNVANKWVVGKVSSDTEKPKAVKAPPGGPKVPDEP